MVNLSTDGVTALAHAAGLAVSDEDLIDVTHRINVLLSGMEKITHPDLDSVDPALFLPPEEQNDDH